MQDPKTLPEEKSISRVDSGKNRLGAASNVLAPIPSSPSLSRKPETKEAGNTTQSSPINPRARKGSLSKAATTSPRRDSSRLSQPSSKSLPSLPRRSSSIASSSSSPTSLRSRRGSTKSATLPSNNNPNKQPRKRRATAGTFSKPSGPSLAVNKVNTPLRFRTGYTNTVMTAMLGLGWQRVPAEDESWDIYWCDAVWVREAPPSAFSRNTQRVCHYPNHYELTRKDCGVNNMKRLKRRLQKEFGKSVDTGCDFYPPTFTLPSEYHMFVEVFKRNKDSVWIMKPVARAQGKGIFLFTKLSEIINWKKDTRFLDDKDKEGRAEMYIVQKYIPNPLLVGGKKFDLRIYVLVTSYKPLTVWLYRQGFGRFSGHNFSMDKKDIANAFIHLTNVAIQKTAADYDKSKGCKWAISRLRSYLYTQYTREEVEKCFLDMNTVIIRSLQSVETIMIQDQHCFEVYGYDILLDDTLKPYLIEVNASPSLTADTQEDKILKVGMLQDTLTIVELDMRKKNPTDLKRVGGYDLMWHDGDVSPTFNENEPILGGVHLPTSTLGTYMGDREESLKYARQFLP
eukprot:m.81166 g.81166  ORF g.81166 m.81166 type:complete len:567 (+) comp12796_c0_seq1:426-2126(+)